MRPYDTSGTDMRSSLTCNSEDHVNHVARNADFSDARQPRVNLGNGASFVDMNIMNNSSSLNNSSVNRAIHQNKNQKQQGTPWLSVPSTSPTSYGMLQHRLPSPGMFKVGGKNPCSMENLQMNLTHSMEKQVCRRSRHFVPSSRKDEYYWVKRQKNNAAARRSREKRRINDLLLEQKVLQLLQENLQLKKDLLAVRVKYNEIDVDEAKELDRCMNEQKSFVFDLAKEEKLKEDNHPDNMKEEPGACLFENAQEMACRRAMSMEGTSSKVFAPVVKQCCCSYSCREADDTSCYVGGQRRGSGNEYSCFQEVEAMHIKKEREATLTSDPFPLSQSAETRLETTMTDQTTAIMSSTQARTQSVDLSLADRTMVMNEGSYSSESRRVDELSYSPNDHSKQEAAFALASLCDYEISTKKRCLDSSDKLGGISDPVVRTPQSFQVMPDMFHQEDSRVYMNGRRVNDCQDFPFSELVQTNLKKCTYRESSVPARCEVPSFQPGNRPPCMLPGPARSPSPDLTDSNSTLDQQDGALQAQLSPGNGNSSGSDSGFSMSPQSSASLQGDAGESFLSDDRAHRLPYKLRFKLGSMTTE